MNTIELRPVQGPLCAPVSLARTHDMLVVCVHESCNTIEIEMGQPCFDCGWQYNCPTCQGEAAYYACMEERVERLGEELAMLPDFMECYDCGREHLMVMEDAWGFRFVWRRPVGLGPVINQRQDPTQTYRLECGHGAM